MRQLAMAGFIACVVTGALAAAQAATPFKLGTFERDGRTFVGIVLRESLVIDFPAAHAALSTPASTMAARTVSPSAHGPKSSNPGCPAIPWRKALTWRPAMFKMHPLKNLIFGGVCLISFSMTFMAFGPCT